MKITYLDHSGFAVEYKKYVFLIFDPGIIKGILTLT